MRSAMSAGAAQAVECLLRAAGREVLLKVRVGGSDAPPMELTLSPCVLRVQGSAAEMLVAASAVERAGDVAGTADSLFAIGARVVADGVVWRAVSQAAIECGDAAVCWRVQLAR